LSRSTDAGATWTRIGNGLQMVTNLVVATSRPSTLYASTVPLMGRSLPFGLNKSTDSGTTWTLLPVSFSSLGDVGSLVIDPTNADVVYVGTGSAGVYKSVDGGESFLSVSDVSLSALGVASMCIDPVRPDTVYIATDAGVFASPDGGGSWKTMSTGLSQEDHLGQLAIDKAGTRLHVATDKGVFDYDLSSSPLTLNAAHPFSITLTATDQRTGRTGTGVATQVNDVWGYFSIPAITNNPNNPEVFVKMLDGTALNGSYWFFYGGLTDLEYTLTVTDVATGRQRTYAKPAGSECGGSDTAAFAP
jgi:hypothetical protein